MTDHPARLDEAIAVAQAALARWRREEDDPDASFPIGGAENDDDDDADPWPIDDEGNGS